MRHLGQALIVAGVQVTHLTEDIRSVEVFDTGHPVELRATTPKHRLIIDTWPTFTMPHWKSGKVA